MNDQVEFYKNKLQYEIDSSDLFEAIKEGDDMVIIDTRKKSAFQVEHIIDSINFPHQEMNSDTIKKLDKNVLYVCYCDGIGCNASTKGALKLTEYGFKVKELLGGLDWWKRDGYKTEGAEAVNNESNILSCGC